MSLSMSRPSITVMAFDFGTKRVGVAVGNSVTQTGQALKTIAVANVDMLFQETPGWESSDQFQKEVDRFSCLSRLVNVLLYSPSILKQQSQIF